VHDDGLGFAAGTESSGETHVGLRIMQERAGSIGATVQVVSAPGEGCSVVLDLPRTREEAASAVIGAAA
jgi:two-component system nitrate/nitrite sensor histidine kinase NarX